METIKGKITKHVYYTVELENGENVSLNTKNIPIGMLEDGYYIEGTITEDEIQDKYDDGSFARSFSTIREFNIKLNG
jgi:hypothetical protein